MNIYTCKTNGNTEFLQLHPVAAADAVLEIDTVIISAVLLLSEHFLQTFSVSQNVITSWCIVDLFDTSLSGCTLLNDSQTATYIFLYKSVCKNEHMFCL
jgi:hypothetical protein